MGFFSKLFGPKEAEIWPVHVDDTNFEKEIFESELPALVDVWGPDCAPCRQLEPIIVRLARTYQGRIKVCEVNSAAAMRVAKRLGVRGTPTVVYYDGRVEVTRVVGFRGELYHREIIDNTLLPRVEERVAKARPGAPGKPGRG